MVLSWAVTSERVFGRLEWIVRSHLTHAECETYYFSTHGCNRLVSCFGAGPLEELAVAAACCRALMLKKSAMLWNGGCESGGGGELKWNASRKPQARVHVLTLGPPTFHQSRHYKTVRTVAPSIAMLSCWLCENPSQAFKGKPHAQREGASRHPCNPTETIAPTTVISHSRRFLNAMLFGTTKVRSSGEPNRS